MNYRKLGYGYAWWKGDPLPELEPLPGFHAAATDDDRLITDLAQLDVAEVRRRIERSHRPYVAYLDQQPVAYGWVATTQGAIDELSFTFAIPPRNRYLWDFVTLPAWRGRGIYARLLQTIIRQERVAADRFWIGHTVDNIASCQGILKAGFQQIEALIMLAGGTLKIKALGASGRAQFSPMALQLGVLEAAD